MVSHFTPLEKQCLVRPSSQKDKKKEMFTERCLQILSRKKKAQGTKQESQMQAMMNRIILNYKKTHLDNKIEILKSCEDSPIIDAKGQAGYSKFSSY